MTTKELIALVDKFNAMDASDIRELIECVNVSTLEAITKAALDRSDYLNFLNDDPL